ncbi:hypothetical protein GGI03_005499 [Coemansia sp. RSA 2337]|nr:hypothetical protein GGI16_005099 [Coemansia sp. S142-1]KAJ2100087.1 hypothetical protein GGI09_002450 [Coemansia sp. S100]KAJ2459628.1 hypothetical protein GGI03_005499 [Coemansia sp. RSA 2337]
MNNCIHNLGDKPGTPAPTQSMSAGVFRETLRGAGIPDSDIARLTQILAPYNPSLAANDHAGAPIAGPAENGYFQVPIPNSAIPPHVTPVASVPRPTPTAHLTAAPPSLAGPTAGSVAAYAHLLQRLTTPTTHLPAAPSSLVSATAPQPLVGSTAPPALAGSAAGLAAYASLLQYRATPTAHLPAAPPTLASPTASSVAAYAHLLQRLATPTALLPAAIPALPSLAAGLAAAYAPQPHPFFVRLTVDGKRKSDDLYSKMGRPPTPPPRKHQRTAASAGKAFGTSSDDEGGEPSASMGASSSAPNDQSNVDHGAVQQHVLTTVLRDGSGEEVTSMRVSLAFGSFFYMPLSIFAILYHCKFGCRLVPKGIRRRAAYEALGTLEGFKLHTITIKNADPDQPVKNANPDQKVKLTVLMRDGPELEAMRANLQERLGLTKKPILPIPEPLMCYSVMMLGCMPLEQLSGAVFQEMLPIITGVDFESLPVATSKGVRRMPYGELCRVAKKWARDLCRYTTNVRNRNKMLGMATRCYIAYTKECHAKENTPADLDLEGKIAKEMLKDGVFSSRLLLGIRKPEFKLLLKHLTFMIKDNKDEGIRTYMRNLSKHLFKQS